MKEILILLLFSLFAKFSGAQNSFKSDDIDGLWQSTKKGSEIFVQISGSTAAITSVGTTTLTKNVVGGNMYADIQFEGKGIWAAQRNAWMYSGSGEKDKEKGSWEKAQKLKLTLSEDKNSLSAAGHWTYKRVVKIITSDIESTSSTTEKHYITEDFGGVTALFTLIVKPGEGDFVIAKFSNTTQKLAVIFVRADDGEITKQRLEPGEGLTKKYNSKKLQIQVNYTDAPAPRPSSFDVMKFMKGKALEILIYTEGGKLNLRKWDATCMCVRG